MQKLWGFGLLLLLGGLLTGCQFTNQSNHARITPTNLANVHRVRGADYLGRWVTPTPATSLYLSANHQLALFQAHHAPIRERFHLKLVADHATLTAGDRHPFQLELTGANSMQFVQNNHQLQLSKDPNWHAQHSVIPTTATVALKRSSLTPEFKPSY